MWHTQVTGITSSEVRILAVAFTDWEGTCLAHHGIKGQKWGVRRFQNPDGTLTEAGRKRVAQSGSYMNIDRSRAVKKIGRINSGNKQKVYEEHHDAWWKNHDAMYAPGSTHVESKAARKLWNSYKDKYASATLKDLKFKDNPTARKQVKAILKEITPDWNNSDPEWKDYEAAAARRKELMHPKRTKAKKKAKAVLNTAASIRKNLP